MLWLFLALLSLQSSYVGCSSGDIPLNPQATLFKDVASINHNEKSRHVVIHLAAERKCAEPTFMVRLSGQSLYLLRLMHNEHTKPNTSVFSYPRLHEPGLYFLEVLNMLCETLNPDSFENQCLVNPDDRGNVLTLLYSFEVKEAAPKSAHPHPRWVLRPNATSAYLPTRYQHWVDGHWHRANKSDIAQHNLYDWTDKPAYEHLLDKTFAWGLSNVPAHTRTGNESITICMVGASHAYHIAKHGNALNITHVNFAAQMSRYPQLFELSALTNCTYAVVGYGQWLLSYLMMKTPYSATRYRNEVRRVLSTIAAAKLKTQVFTYSMNLCPLGFREGSCPAADYRQPPIIMMYNQIMSELSAEYSIPYIDMIPLQGPLWDIALDWNHPKGRVFTAEAELIVHSVLSYSHTHHQAPVLDPNFAMRAPTPAVTPSIRFGYNNNDTVYMLLGGVYRPFLNETTTYRLGGRWALRVVNETDRAEYKFGPPVPEI